MDAGPELGLLHFKSEAVGFGSPRGHFWLRAAKEDLETSEKA